MYHTLGGESHARISLNRHNKSHVENMVLVAYRALACKHVNSAMHVREPKPEERIETPENLQMKTYFKCRRYAMDCRCIPVCLNNSTGQQSQVTNGL